MAVKIRKATDSEKQAYRGTYPLSHIATMDGHTIPVEYLGGEWSKENPQYEARFPEGFHCEYGVTHFQFGLTLKHLKSRLDGERLVPCGDHCK